MSKKRQITLLDIFNKNKKQETEGSDELQAEQVQDSLVEGLESHAGHEIQSVPILIPDTHISGNTSLPNDIGSKDEGPRQSQIDIPVDKIKQPGKRITTRFQKKWCIKHKWITYSISRNKLYCFACIFFQSSAKENSFTLTGFDNWNHAVGDKNKGLDHHASTSVHIQAMIKWEHYQSNQVTIQERLNPYRSTLVNDNRDYFHKIISYIKWFCLQEVALSGETENDDQSSNRGNFRELLELEFQLHPQFKVQRESIMSQYSIHTDYLSKTIYNELISIMADEVRQNVYKEISETKLFSLIIDECKDFTKSEQLSICIRYCYGSVPSERFLGFVHLSEGSYTAKEIVTALKKIVDDLLSHGCLLVGLGADGASVMSGEIGGVQTLLKQIHPWLIYIHCVAHRLNLVVVKALKEICPRLIKLVDKLHTLFSSSKTNDVFIKIQHQEKARKILAMPARSEVRWSSMFHVLDILCSCFYEILLTLNKRASDSDDPAITAGGLYHQLATGKMILTCVILKNALAITTNLSDILQGKSLEWNQAAHEIEMVKILINNFKSEESVSSQMEEAQAISEKCSLPLHISSPVYSLRSYIEGSELDVDSYAKEFSTQIANKLNTEMNLRFPKESIELLKGMDGLNPKSSKFIDETSLLKVVDHYGAGTLNISKSLLSLEVRKYQLQIKLSASPTTTVEMNPSSYPNLMKLFNLKRSLPVSSAEAERSFSTMKRVKTALRNRVGDEKMSNLCLLSAERDISKKLDINVLIDKFNKNPRRVPLK